MTTLRYVILHHEGIDEPHFDLMFEVDPSGPLVTFRSPVWPIVQGVQLTRLADHRREYLDYEGPVSGNRGTVRRVATGTYELARDAGSTRIAFRSGTDSRTLSISDSAWCDLQSR